MTLDWTGCPVCGLQGCAAPRADAEEVSAGLAAQIVRALELTHPGPAVAESRRPAGSPRRREGRRTSSTPVDPPVPVVAVQYA